MSAGAVLVSVVSDGIGALEKVRRHDVASEHLAWLLFGGDAQPFAAHKRGGE